MRNIVMITLLIFALPVAVIAHGPAGQNKSDKVEIAPSDVLEKCLKMNPDQVLEYSFKASKPMAFNLHYHLIDETVFHVKEEAAERKEVFHPVKEQKVYCMEWKNSGEDTITLDYSYSVKESH